MKKYILLICVLFSTNLVISQEVDTTYKYWINIGTFPRNKDLSIHYSFNFVLENLSLNALFLGTGEFFGPNSDGYSTKSISTSVGYSSIQKNCLIAFYAGPGIIWGENHNYPNRYNFNNICLSANIQAYFLPFKNWGLGLEFITNQNSEHSLNRIHLSINYLIN
jgi:hypothetical protein